jgi:very-short-patch-repair endonuclease
VVEIEGGVYVRGRHLRPSGFVKDIEKYNALTMLGFALLRFAGQHVKSGYALEQTRGYLERHDRKND